MKSKFNAVPIKSTILNIRSVCMNKIRCYIIERSKLNFNIPLLAHWNFIGSSEGLFNFPRAPEKFVDSFCACSLQAINRALREKLLPGTFNMLNAFVFVVKVMPIFLRRDVYARAFRTFLQSPPRVWAVYHSQIKRDGFGTLKFQKIWRRI